MTPTIGSIEPTNKLLDDNDSKRQSYPHCVQCCSEMEFGTTICSSKDKNAIIDLSVCSNPGCPNFGLFQAGVEIMLDNGNK